MTDNATSTHTTIARIGEAEINLPDLLRSLINRQHWNVVEECLDHKLIETWFAKEAIKITPEDLHAYINAFRKRHGLLSGDEMHKYLAKHHMSDARFLEMCQFDVALQKLKEAMFEKRLHEYFAYRQLELTKVELYKIAVASEEAAKEIIALLRDGGSFFDFARRYSTDEHTRKLCGYMGTVPLHQLEPKVQELLAGSANGAVIGPVKVSREFHILLVEKIHSAELDEETRQDLLDELFNQCLTEAKERGVIKALI